MPIEITMPRLSDTMEQGTIVKWNIKEGDSVSSGDVIADVETDKATMELQVYDDGTIAKLAVGEGQQVAVGTVIAVLAGAGEDVKQAAGSFSASSGSSAASAPAKDKKASAESTSGSSGSSGSSTASTSSTATKEPEERQAEAAAASSSSNGTHSSERIFASPLARKIAAEKGIDLSTLHGTGPSGRIVRKDVEQAPAATAQPDSSAKSTKAAAESAPAPMPVDIELSDRTVTLNNMRGTIARRLVESKQTIPHYQVTVSVRLDALLSLREQLNDQLEEQGVKLSVNDFLVRACAVAMHRHPFVNSSWNPKGPAIDLHGRVNIGVAIALPEERGGGLVVATIRDADRQGLRYISSETKRLAKKAREKGLTIEEMSDSTFTISNLGMFGVDHFTAIINPPNAAILAVGRSIEKPFIEYDEQGEPMLVVGHEMAMTMSSDHRIVDGAMAAQYLTTVKSLLEQPAGLLV